MRIGVDAGGTFTDFVVLDGNGRVSVFKLRSNPADPAAVILSGVRQAAARAGEAPSEVVHGSTVATNALLERKGARTALVTSPGFRDVLRIGRQNRAELYALRPSERVNLVPWERTFAWTGDAKALLEFAQNGEAEAVAICLLGAYANADEERAAELALSRHDIYVCRSSEIAPEFREYERASTTVLNAYVGPLMDQYLGRIEAGCPFPIRIMQSNGGLLSANEARRHAVRTILSGPAGGVVGARAMAAQAGWTQAIAFDMGGTSTDVSLVEDPFRFATEAWIEGLPIRTPLLDIHTVGAGGGSLASVDEGGRLRVGPESAGARPGPACYGSGDRATVTDAHVVLGRLRPERFLDGSMPIDAARAERAVAEIGSALGLDAREAAEAIVRIANSNMERALRVVSVEKGRDPRGFPLVAFGGCGGLHACEVAEGLGISTVIFPPFAGVLSAVGMLLAPAARDYAASALGRTDYDAIAKHLRERALADMPDADLASHADVRYAGQSYELTVPWESGDPRPAFEEAYRAIYGFHDSDRAIEVVTVRVRAVGPADVHRSDAWFDRAVSNYWPAETRPVNPSPGPALLFDYGSTIYIPQGWVARSDRGGAVIAARAEDVDTLPGRA